VEYAREPRRKSLDEKAGNRRTFLLQLSERAFVLRARADGQCDLIFVYGTLRPGFEAYRLLQTVGAHHLGQGSVCGELADLGRFPGALKPDVAPAGEGSQDRSETTAWEASSVDGSHGSRIVGDVFRLVNSNRAFKLLDGYEGFRRAAPGESLFIRELTEVTLRNGRPIVAWIYWLNRSAKGARRIKSGDYGDNI
jgi:gamma-glutamylcyclotransferase (GGCT)/AIG2-like uncharacterized protein YtfP